MPRNDTHPFLIEIQNRIKESKSSPLQNIIASHIRDIAAVMPPTANNNLYDLVIGDVEKPLIEYALEQCRGNQIRAAKLLGINRNTLHKKIRTLNIAPKKKKNG